MKYKLARKILDKVEKNFNDIAAEFSQTRQYNWEDLKFFRKYIKPGMKILDLGCGNGRLFDFLKEFKVSCLGVDVSEGLLKEARKRYPRAKFKKGDFLHIPAKDREFDVVFCIASFHHLPSLEMRITALQEIKRVLKEDGILIMTNWNLYQPKYKKYLFRAFFKAVFTLGRYGRKDIFVPWGKEKRIMRYYYAFKLNEIVGLVKKGGFEVLESFVVRKGKRVDKLSDAYNLCVVGTIHELPLQEFQDKINILGIDFDRVTKKEALLRVFDFLRSKKQHYIVTPNPEMVLESKRNKEFLKVLNNASLSIADGVGILVASLVLTSKLFRFSHLLLCFLSLIFYPKYCRKILPERVTGTDLMWEICEMQRCRNRSRPVPTREYKIFLLGAKKGIADELAIKIKALGSNVVGVYSGTPFEKDEKKILEVINQRKPDVLFVAFGAPAQELWIFRNLEKMPSVKVAMGVGGAFDFLVGEVSRAPLLFRKTGLEWLWRLLKQPWRVRRIYNAVVRFSIEVCRRGNS